MFYHMIVINRKIANNFSNLNFGHFWHLYYTSTTASNSVILKSFSFTFLQYIDKGVWVGEAEMEAFRWPVWPFLNNIILTILKIHTDTWFVDLLRMKSRMSIA